MSGLTHYIIGNMENQEHAIDNNLETAQKFIKIAKGHADYRKNTGYNEDDYSLWDIINLDACMEICTKGPADYYYEKAYDILCSKYGKDHPETRKLVEDIIQYHVNNTKRMMYERYGFVAFIIMIFIIGQAYTLYGRGIKWVIAFLTCYTVLFTYWAIELFLLCQMVKRHYRKEYY